VLDGKLDKTPITFRAPTVPENVRDIFANDNEFARFYGAMADATPRLRDIKNIAYLISATGLRDGDVAYLEREDFDFEADILRIRNKKAHKTKNRREHEIPITPRITDAFRLQVENKLNNPNPLVRESRYLFSNSQGGPYVDSDGKTRPISKMFREQRKRILPNRPGLHPHSIRHSVAQCAYDSGVPLRDITILLNHKGEGITEKHYARLRSYRKAENQFKSIEEYLNSLPVLSRQERGRPREPLQGSLTISELSSCNISEVLE
jgi:integrase